MYLKVELINEYVYKFYTMQGIQEIRMLQQYDIDITRMLNFRKYKLTYKYRQFVPISIKVKQSNNSNYFIKSIHK